MRTIDADAFISELRKESPVEDNGAKLVVELLVAAIEGQPTIDAVPVVRCRHCQSHHWEQEPCHGKTVHYCKKLDAEVTADFFCAAGKRKDGEG